MPENSLETMNWSQIKEEIRGSSPTLLIGNGFSIAFSDNFRYSCIKEKIKYLEDIDDCNIERILCTLQNTVHSNDDIYSRIAKNIIHQKINTDVTQTISQLVPNISTHKSLSLQFISFLAEFSSFFSLNYDLLLYWLLLSTQKMKKNTAIQTEEQTAEGERPPYDQYKEAIKALSSILQQDIRISLENNEGFVEVYDNMDILKIKPRKNFCKSLLDQSDAAKKIIEKYPQEKNSLYNEAINMAQGYFIEKCPFIDFRDGFRHRISHTCPDLIFNPSGKENVFFLHGAIHLFENEGHIFKEHQTSNNAMIQKIIEKIKQGTSPLIVFEGTAEEKEEKINRSTYLKNARNNFQNISGTLIVFGVSFAQNDSHIIRMIQENEQLERIYIGYFSNEEKENFEHLFSDLNKKVCLFQTIDFFNRYYPSEMEKTEN